MGGGAFVFTVANWPELILLFGLEGDVLPGQTVGGEFENEGIRKFENEVVMRGFGDVRPYVCKI